MADQRGAAMIEYSILITVVAGCLLFTVTAVALWSQGSLNSFRAALTAPASTAAAGPVPASGGDGSPAVAGDDASSPATPAGGGGVPPAADPVVGANGNGNGNNGKGLGNGGSNGTWSGSNGGTPHGCRPCGRGSR